MYASTALHEHQFNLQENLHQLTREQQTYVHGILMECLNQPKVEQMLSELKALHPKEGSLEQSWLDDLRKASEKNFSNHLPLLARVPSLSKEWINNLVRILGSTSKMSQFS